MMPLLHSQVNNNIMEKQKSHNIKKMEQRAPKKLYGHTHNIIETLPGLYFTTMTATSRETSVSKVYYVERYPKKSTITVELCCILKSFKNGAGDKVENLFRIWSTNNNNISLTIQ